MPYFFYYLLKVILCSAVLFGYYHLFLRNKVYHAYNRFYLLAATVISLAAPLLNFDLLFNDNEAEATSIQLLQAVNSSDAYLEEIIIYSHKNYISSSQLLLLMYSLVSLVMLFLLVKVFIQIFKILNSNSSRTLNDVVFVQSDAKGTPFSFFKFIFWNKAIDINTPTGRQIFAHELAHVREKHSLDKLYINLLLIVFWINPIFWFIKKELNLIHEFIADRKAVADNDAGALAAMIVQSAYPQHSYLLTSHFFYSPIKRRLKMLTKYNNKKAGYLYRILALPVVLFLVAALTIKAKSGISELINPAEKITVVIDAGHGGTDPGAMAPDGKTSEKELTLALVKKIKELNNLSNIELVFTRETDIYQHPSVKTGIAKNATADLFISVHISNGPAASNNTKSGAEIFISRDEFSNSFSSKLFASSVIEKFKGNYGLSITPNPIQRKLGIAVLQTEYPAVLIEAGYLNNTKDLAYLKSDEGQTTFAKNILAAIASFANNKNNTQQDFNGIARDTIPTETYGRYKGQDITGITITPSKEKTVTLTLAGGKKVALTETEAKDAGIDLPPPPGPGVVPPPPPPPPGVPAPPPPPAPPTPPTLEDVRIDASQRTTIVYDKGHPQVREIVLRGTGIHNNGIQPLYVLNDKVMEVQSLHNLDPNSIEAITVLKGEQAVKKYGMEKSMNGVVEIKTKPITLEVLEEKKIPISGVTVSNPNNLYVGVNNIIHIPDAPTGTKISVANGRVTEASKGKWNVEMAAPCQTTLWVTSAEGKTLGSYAFNSKYLPENFKGSLNHTMFIQDRDLVFTKVEKEAEFPGGADAWRDYLIKELDAGMPKQDAWKNGTYTMIIRFIVNTDGSIRDVVAENYAKSKTAAMCMNLISKGPKWKPAVQNGKIVNAYRRQPITFVVKN